MISSLLLAALELSPILSDRMVLQAETAVPIWGKADPGAKGTDLVIAAGQETRTIRDVLVG